MVMAANLMQHLTVFMECGNMDVGKYVSRVLWGSVEAKVGKETS